MVMTRRILPWLPSLGMLASSFFTFYQQNQRSELLRFQDAYQALLNRTQNGGDVNLSQPEPGYPKRSRLEDFATRAVEQEINKHDRIMTQAALFMADLTEQELHDKWTLKGNEKPRVCLNIFVCNRRLPYINALFMSLMDGADDPRLVLQYLKVNLLNVERRPERMHFPLYRDKLSKLPFVTHYNFSAMAQEEEMADSAPANSSSSDKKQQQPIGFRRQLILDTIQSLKICNASQLPWCLVVEEDAILASNFVPHLRRLIAHKLKPIRGNLSLVSLYSYHNKAIKTSVHQLILPRYSRQQYDRERAKSNAERRGKGLKPYKARYRVIKRDYPYGAVALLFPREVLEPLIEFLTEHSHHPRTDADVMMNSKGWFPSWSGHPRRQVEFVLLPALVGEENGSASQDEGKEQPRRRRPVVWKIQNHKFQQCLAVVDGEEGTAVCTVTAEDAEGLDDPRRAHWTFHKEVDTGRAMITSLYNGQSLMCDKDMGVVGLSSSAEERDTTAESGCWHVETVTGELCYLSNARLDQRLRCDMVGLLSLTDNCKGWEVWRLMESGGNGHVRMSSWMHSQYLLCCQRRPRPIQPPESAEDVAAASGEKVATRTEEEEDDWDYRIMACSLAAAVNDPNMDTEWAISKAGADGVAIQSQTFGRVLSVTTEGKLCAADAQEEDTGASAVWQTEAAHLQKYTLALTHPIVSVDKEGAETSQMISVGPFPFCTPQLRQTDEWSVEQRAPGVVAFCAVHDDRREYLCATLEGGVLLRSCTSATRDVESLWIMQAEGGGYTFQSKAHGTNLQYRDGAESSGTLVAGPASLSTDKLDVEGSTAAASLADGKTASSASDTSNNDNIHKNRIWSIHPVMPRAVSSSKIKTFAIGTSIAVGTTVAMPFAMMGVMGLLGAVGAEVGLLANIVTVGLTGAEALASVGVVGATAAIIFRESNDSLTLEEEDDKEERRQENAAIARRPFCSWRSW